ncbi:MAG: hypothetical protein WBL47_05995 [Bacilli bacterium]|jgi:hypothetical protein|nr:hypothetical protein [Bacillota bacterium]NLM31511.1 hypothetical protein [Acholeplasmataceae bacterium]
MKYEKYHRLTQNYFAQLVVAFVSALLLIMTAIVLFEDIDLDNTMLIYNIYGTLALVGFIYSYNLTKKHLRSELEVGVTRKRIYRNYLFNTLISLMISLFLVAYYMFIYKKVIRNTLTLPQLFDFKKIIFLPLIYLLISFSGFILGIIQMRKKVFYVLFSIVVSGLVLIIIYLSITYYVNMALLLAVLILAVINYFLIANYRV